VAVATPSTGVVKVLLLSVSVPARVASVLVTVGRVMIALLLAILLPVRSKLSPDANSYIFESEAFAIRGNLFVIYLFILKLLQ